ncbi:MAG: CIA30 family protein [Bacteroidetes bacterium]|nr:CIA30 family protein [Bacteroidota bacterium]
MKQLLGIVVMSIMMSNPLYDFNAKNSDAQWRVVDDVVMGGRSAGNFEINEEGHGHFYGAVSLENNGGFSSIRYTLDSPRPIDNAKKVLLKVKGDGKRYQFRIKSKRRDYYSYIAYFETSGEWENIELELNDFYPSFRGRKLDLPNFDQDQIEEISILIANYKAEEFDLLIDKLDLID